MQTREPLHNRVYKDLLSQIYEGILPYNSTLPTLFFLRHTYGVSDNSIRAALVQLRKRGYISTARGRGAQVIFDVNAPEAQKNCHRRSPVTKRIFMLFMMPSTFCFLPFTRLLPSTARPNSLMYLHKLLRRYPDGGELCRLY